MILWHFLKQCHLHCVRISHHQRKVTVPSVINATSLAHAREHNCRFYDMATASGQNAPLINQFCGSVSETLQQTHSQSKTVPLRRLTLPKNSREVTSGLSSQRF